MTGVSPVLPGPQRVINSMDALEALPGVLASDDVTTALFVHGERSLHAALPYLPTGLSGVFVEGGFRGECSPSEIARLVELVLASGAGAVVGLGGGKALDTAKAVAARAGRIPVYLVPTLASTCSAWSALSVFYDDEHRHLGHEVWPTPTRAVFIDPRIVFDSPVDYFVSGIADTLAKWVETRSAFAAAELDELSRIGADSARRCGEVVRTDGVTAVADMRAGRLSPSWRHVAEAGILTAGLVGGFGGTAGSATAAHPVGDGLSALPGTRDLLHGVKVAYGILVQLAHEGHWDDVAELGPLYAELGLPRSLADLGLSLDDTDEIEAIAGVAVLPESSIHLLSGTSTAATVIEAIRSLESHQADLPRVSLAGRIDEQAESRALVPGNH
ncbi:iron-containing alcohol dehydrogenase family protein [Amnibacterium flavum]|uniref:Oxidoreductase n=1 Tax=Amnibacterium flavum TaxID=2173173 RepID=A0A2V1HRA2_9MICO|nr:iron-containing alcohol dehydrogenase family protein [Amnibacterium flavum]PVZ94182.1 oxidoreductase [Amnibacterium flavum]